MNSSDLNKTNSHKQFDTIELICTIWFTLELICRFVLSPFKMEFMKNFLNFIDIVSILPYLFYSIVIEIKESHDEQAYYILQNAFQIFQIMKMIRILKLVHHSIELQYLFLTLKRSWKELFMLMIFIIVNVFLFGTIIYVFESSDSNSQINSIPRSFW